MSDKGNVRSLGDVLAKKVNVIAQAPAFDEPIEDVNFTLADEPIVNAPPVAEPESAQAVQPLPNGSAPLPPDNGFMPHRDMAENIVEGVDLVQENLIIYFLKEKLFTADEKELMKTMDFSGKTVYQDGPEAKLMVKHNRFEALAAKLPFTDRERTVLTNSSERYARTVNLQMSPFMGLCSTFGIVMGKRAAIIMKEI
jgi:hypothetical protein